MNKQLIVSLAAAVVIAFFFWYSSVLQDEFWRVVNIFNGLVEQNESVAIVVFILTAAVAAVISPLTNLPLVPFAVAIWGSEITTVMLLTGWFMGGIVSYCLGRYLGARVVSYVVRGDRFDRWSVRIREKTTFPTALLARLAFPAELGYVFGMVKYPFVTYGAVTILSEFPYAVISAYASEAIIVGDLFQFFGLVGILMIIIVVTLNATLVRKNNTDLSGK